MSHSQIAEVSFVKLRAQCEAENRYIASAGDLCNLLLCLCLIGLLAI